MTKGRIVDIGERSDDNNNTWYSITVFSNEKPDLKLGKCEVKQ